MKKVVVLTGAGMSAESGLSTFRDSGGLWDRYPVEDVATPEGYARSWEDFSRVIGFSYLKGMHINDSKKGLGSRVDRHAPLGKGELGEEFFRILMADERMNNIPLILETPDEAIWPEEVNWLYSLGGAL